MSFLLPAAFLPAFLLIGGGRITGIVFLDVHWFGLGDFDWLGLLNGMWLVIRLSDEDLDGFFAFVLFEEDLEIFFAVDSHEVAISVLVLEGVALEVGNSVADGLDEVIEVLDGSTDSVDLVLVLNLE